VKKLKAKSVLVAKPFDPADDGPEVEIIRRERYLAAPFDVPARIQFLKDTLNMAKD